MLPTDRTTCDHLARTLPEPEASAVRALLAEADSLRGQLRDAVMHNGILTAELDSRIAEVERLERQVRQMMTAPLDPPLAKDESRRYQFRPAAWVAVD